MQAFTILSDPVRRRILEHLCVQELSSGDVVATVGEEFGITQSAISQHIRSLERFLGQALFIRQSRALALTEEASNYLPAVREAFRVLQTGTSAFPGMPSGRSVTLQCNMGFATFCLIPRMASLLTAHPWLELNIVTPIWDPEQTSARADVEIRFGFVDARQPDEYDRNRDVACEIDRLA